MPLDTIRVIQDSTNIIQDILNWQDPAIFWTALGALATVAGIFLALLPVLQSRKKRRLLTKVFGADLYDEGTIERSTRYYVEPYCTDIDPAVEVELRKVAIVQDNLFDAVDRFLDTEGPRKHLLLLADSGMGKTSFMLNYYAANQKKRFKRKRIAIIPLGIPDVDERITAINRKKDTILFLDAFDEDTRAIRNHRDRIFQLMQLCREFKRVLITCRSQFFLSDEEIVETTGIIRVGSTGLGEKKEFEFMKLYISPLDDDQVKSFLRKRYRFEWKKRRKARALVAKVPLLTVRPMLLAYIPDLIETDKEILFSTDIYQEMVAAWAVRESSFWREENHLVEFSKHLAIDLYTRREERGQEKVEPEELEALAGGWGFKVEGWQLTGRSLLNRDAGRNYKFAHRSIMEYLFARQVKDNPDDLARVYLTEQIQRFLLELHDIDTSHYRFKNECSAFELGKKYGRIYKHAGSTLASYVRARPEPMLVQVPEGVFKMGAVEGGDREKPQHEVYLSPFWIGKYPVTNLDYYAFISDAGHTPPDEWTKGDYPRGKSDHPVVNVTRHDAMAYCSWLAEKTGKNYTLPTEAQWEKAARGTDGRIYPWGDQWDTDKLNSHESGIKTTTAVGQYSLLGNSPYGASDMAGNVWEWCLDWFDENTYKRRKSTVDENPSGPQSGQYRILRGGSFAFYRSHCRCAYRYRNFPGPRYDYVGFRVVLLPGDGTSPTLDPENSGL